MINNYLQSIYRHLGDRFNLQHEAGFIRTYRFEILKFAIITPIVLEIAQSIFENKNKNDSNNDLKDNAINVLKQNSTAVITSSIVLTLFLSFKEMPPVVYTGYTIILIANVYKLIQTHAADSKYDSLKHLFSACVTVATIGKMISGSYDVRWHHMSYGLLCLLFDVRNMNFFGASMVADSMLYWARPLKDNYDFSNIFEENLSKFIIQSSVLTVCEISKKLFK